MGFESFFKKKEVIAPSQADIEKALQEKHNQDAERLRVIEAQKNAPESKGVGGVKIRESKPELHVISPEDEAEASATMERLKEESKEFKKAA